MKGQGAIRLLTKNLIICYGITVSLYVCGIPACACSVTESYPQPPVFLSEDLEV